MEIRDYIESKEVKQEELNNLFELESESIFDTQVRSLPCPNCGNPNNLYNYPSPSWTSCYHCVNCNRILFIHLSDRMGGVHVDTVFIYKPKEQ